MSQASIAKATAGSSEPHGIDMDRTASELELSWRLRRAGLRPTLPRMLLLKSLHDARDEGLPLMAIERKLTDDGNGVSHSSLLNSLRELAYKRLIRKAPGQPQWLKVAEVIWLDAEFGRPG